jgi:hypothetical protein
MLQVHVPFVLAFRNSTISMLPIPQSTEKFTGFISAMFDSNKTIRGVNAAACTDLASSLRKYFRHFSCTSEICYQFTKVPVCL